MLLWSVGHLLANGDSRALVLFGGLGIWAILEMWLISRRDGAWVKPPIPSLKAETLGVVTSLAIYTVLVYLHPYFTGLSPVAALGAH